MRTKSPAVAIVLAVACGRVLALVSVYHVDPVKAAWSAWAHRGDAVSEGITCNFDEPIYAEFFTGTATGAEYHVEIRVPGRTPPLVVADGAATEPRNHVWVRCTLDVQYPESIIKGRLYEVRWTLSGGTDSLMYYYDSTDKYKYGGMAVGQQVPIPNPNDLACRVYGRMNPVSDVWRACVNHGWDPEPDSGGTAALAKADSIGVKWLRDDFYGWDGYDGWAAGRDTLIYNQYQAHGWDSLMGILCYCRTDSSVSSCSPGDSRWTWCMHPPRNLDTGRNYWAEYCAGVMQDAPTVKYWEVWPEANASWCWEDPDTAFYHGSSGLSYDPIDTPRERCSLYVRMCYLAKHASPSVKIVAGAVWRLREPESPWGEYSSGASWLADMFDIAKLRYGAAESCFDVVSTHPYTWVDTLPNEFDEDMFCADLDTALAIMRDAGYPGMDLWATEYGWPRFSKVDTLEPLTDTLMQARNLCQFYTSAVARQADPRGSYDRSFLYELTGFHSSHNAIIDNQCFGLLDSVPDQTRMPHSWTMRQVGEQLTGKRCNGRVMVGSTSDDSVRLYEFEDPATLKRTWVCWQNEAVTAYTPVPVRNDTVDTVALAYNGSPPAHQKGAENSGWLHIALDPRPAFVTEKSAASRPDLVVDSVRHFQPPDTIAVRAWVTNRGSRATPRQSPGNQPYPTWAVLYANGDSLAETEYTDSIPAESSAVFEFARGAMQMPQTALLSVLVNPGQSYVELATDDNAGHALTVR